jgi:hypothetical protein
VFGSLLHTEKYFSDCHGNLLAVLVPFVPCMVALGLEFLPCELALAIGLEFCMILYRVERFL